MIIWNSIKAIFQHIKYTRILREVYKNEHLVENLSQLFNTEFKVDWVDRIYTVLNPNLIDGIFDPNRRIYEYGKDGLVNDTQVEVWIMERLNLAKNFIKANNLFDLLTYKIKKLDEYENYLFIIQPITYNDFKKHIVILFFEILVIIGIVVSLFYFI